MPALDYRIVDVFADAPLAGNPLAVFTNAAALDSATMQRLAAETNLSETTFVTGGDAARPGVRIFTPGLELPFAGHPTLGTAAVIAPKHDVTLELGVGAVAVHYDADGDRYWLDAPPVADGAPLDADDILAITGLHAGDLDADFPPQRLRAGPEFLFVPLASMDALARCTLDLARYRARFPNDPMPNVYPFARGGDPGFDLTCRLFFLAGGVREDPATGSAAACLGHWLSTRRYLGTADVDICVSQGGWMDRPSRLFVRARGADKAPAVQVGGQVQPVASGRFVLPD